MNKILAFAAVACAAVFTTTGCMSVDTNDAAVSAKANVSKDFKADITVQDKPVSGEATIHNILGIISWGVSEFADDAFMETSNNPISLFKDGNAIAKQGATFKACEAAKADYILGAKYRIDTKNYFIYKQINCKVTGFPGNIKGVK